MATPRLTIQTPRPTVVGTVSPAPAQGTRLPKSTVQTPRPTIVGVR